ncbi:MAG: GTP pyrophosphokinase family protein [Deltaproteobacteria bacterium]|nr:GTP pyrophosphokinase family protein [Deltaproteobacteria bacterium]
MIHEQILGHYDLHLPAFQALKARLQASLVELLSQNGIEVHAVSSRVKSRESLRYKLSRPDKTYRAVWDVTDLLGLRVTTYFEDQIEDVARLIEKHFRVDFNHSADKLGGKAPDSFGYRSLHYVCSFGATDSAAPQLPPEFHFEIQIRTILQHAWAEVEHDLAYKANGLTPLAIRRRFSRIASLLEIADEEFVSIRRDLESYEQSVRNTLTDPTLSFPLDGVSLQSTVQSAQVLELDQAIATLLGKELSPEVFFPEYLVKMLRLAGLQNTRDLAQALTNYRAGIVEMVTPYFEFTNQAWRLAAGNLVSVYRGYSLFFLSHVIILQSPLLEANKVSKLAQFYRELDYPDDESSAQRVAAGLFGALRHLGKHGA